MALHLCSEAQNKTFRKMEFFDRLGEIGKTAGPACVVRLRQTEQILKMDMFHVHTSHFSSHQLWVTSST